MARKVFDPEGLVWKPLGYVGEIVMLSLLWGVCSIPLVTVGPATAALYDCSVRSLRRGEGETFSRFWRCFRAELRTGLLSTLLWAAVLGALYFLRALLMRRLGYAGAGSAVGMAALVVLLVPTGMACWAFPLLSRFTFSFGALNVTAVRLALGHILRTLALALLTLLGTELCLRYTSPLIFTPGLVALLWSYLIEPVFALYIEKTE